MTQNDSELLRRYVASRSERAFAELVHRYIDLVYSAALRHVNGDTHSAEDITQGVFESLARKAAALTRHTSLAGWLYLTTRYVAFNTRRAEHRRQIREQEAHAMNQLLQTGDPPLDWEQLRPVIDDTMCELDDEDREAVLLKFFQNCSLAEIGIRLGIKENAAHMRIERALGKLRQTLAKRGITSTEVMLAASLLSNAVSAAPEGMATRVCRLAVAGVVTGGGLTALLLSAPAKLALGIAVAAALIALFFHHAQSAQRTLRVSGTSAVPQTTNAIQTANASTGLSTKQGMPPIPVSTATGPRLMLLLEATKTGKPVRDVRIDDRCWSKIGFRRLKFYSDWNGRCEIPCPSNVTHLELMTRKDGYADTRLNWQVAQGNTIPSAFTVHLDPAVLIGGQVVDAKGRPVAGAKVGWNEADDPAVDSLVVNHDFDWIQVTADADGRWQINRIAGDMIRRLYGSAQDPYYVDSPLVQVEQDPAAEKQLRAGTFVFHLGAGMIVQGTVVDADKYVVPGARIFVGRVGESGRRKTTAGADGEFVVLGCKPGSNLLTAEAPGYANATMEINITSNLSPVQIVLRKGGVLRLLVQNRSGTPIPNAWVGLETLNNGVMNVAQTKLTSAQADFNRYTDSAGRLVWSNAPTGKLKFAITAPDYMRQDNVTVMANGKEHVVTLGPALVIHGTVRDAGTGGLIPHFKIGIGWPQWNPLSGKTNDQWSSIDQNWPEFFGGHYHQSIEQPVVYGIPNPGYVLKFQADGYASYVSRTIAPDEGNVRLDVSLHRAEQITVTVLTPRGQPAANAEVGIVVPGSQLWLSPGHFSQANSGGFPSVLTADDSGRFQFTVDNAISRVIAVCAAGYAKTTPAVLEKLPTMRLQPWGRIKAICLSGGQPAAGREYLFELSRSNEDDYNTLSTDFRAYRAKSDAQGRFTLPMVPPGKHSLVRLIPQSVGPHRMGWMHGNRTEVDIQPGKTTTVTLGNKGYTITADLQWPGGVVLTNVQINAMLYTLRPPLPAGLAGHPNLIEKYYLSPAFRALAKTFHNYPMALGSDGSLVADDVPAGKYHFFVQVLPFQPNDNSTPALSGEPELSVTVPSKPPTGQLNLGAIELQPMPVQPTQSHWSSATAPIFSRAK